MFRQLTLADAVHVATYMRPQDRECIEVVTGVSSPEVFALNRWQTHGAAWTMLHEGEPIAIGGLSQATPWTAVMWFVAVEGFRSWKKLLRQTRRVIFNAAKTIPRIEVHVLSTWPEANDFALALGFHLESTRRRAGRDGQDVLVFVWPN